MHARMLLLCATLPLLACRAGGSDDDEQAEQADTSSEGGETSPDACSVELPCEAGYCVAPWDEQTRMRGVAQCVAECVGELELDRFCIDDASCCEGLECAIDGLCEPPWQPSSESDSGTSESDSGTSESDSGTSDSGTSESGSTSSTS
jgi:hypothetical protein